MDKILAPIKQNILLFIKYQGVNKISFFENLGLSASNFRGNSLYSEVGGDVIAKILSQYPEINPEWLLTGKGSMLKTEKDLVIAAPVSNGGIPLLPFEAFAGLGDSGVSGVAFDVIEDRYVIPLFEGIQIDFMIPVRGSSMYPKYSSGDVVACRLISELLFIQWNKVYVLDSKSQGVIMKRVKKSQNPDFILCKSDNKDYDEFEIPRSDIRNIALVVGVIRLE